MSGDPDILIKSFAEDFSLRRAMAEAGYFGRGSISRAVHDIEEHADTLRREVLLRSRRVTSSEALREERRRRILEEYRAIAFASPGDEVKVSDKLRALEMYRVLSEKGEEAEAGEVQPISIIYDYGDGISGGGDGG